MSTPTPAEELLLSLGVTEPSEIDLEAIAWTLRVKVRYRPLDGCEARIVGSMDTAIVTVNSRCSLGRQRYSIGHELGHWKFHRGKSLACRSSDIEDFGGKGSPAEKHADRFAASLLMPRYLYLPALRAARRLNFDVIRSMAEQFKVSITAAAIRCIEIGDTPAMVVFHTPTGRSWFLRSSLIPDSWFPRKELQPESPSMTLLFNKSATLLAPTRLSSVSAEAWFDCYNARKYEVTEQAIKISPTEILSLVILEDEEMLEADS